MTSRSISTFSPVPRPRPLSLEEKAWRQSLVHVRTYVRTCARPDPHVLPPYVRARLGSRAWLGESGAGVAVKANHDSDGEIRWSASPVANGLDSSHGSVDKANINPEVAGEHHTGWLGQADDCLQSSCIVSWGLGCIGSSMNCLDGGNGLATGLELSHVVLDHSFNSGDEVEGSGRRGRGPGIWWECGSWGGSSRPLWPWHLSVGGGCLGTWLALDPGLPDAWLGPGPQPAGMSGRQLSPGQRVLSESQWCRGAQLAQESPT